MSKTTNLEYELIPMNGKILFEKITLEVSKKENNNPLSAFEEQMLDEVGFRDATEIFMVSYDTAKYPVGTLVCLSTYEPVGFFNDKQFFVADEKAINVIIKKNEQWEKELNEEGESQ